MTSGARQVRAALLIVITTALVVAPAFAAGLVMRLDGAGVSTVSTIMLTAVIVHAMLGLWLLWPVALGDTFTVRARYWWWVGLGAAVVLCLAFAMMGGFAPSRSAMLDIGLGVLGVILTRREIRSIGAVAGSPVPTRTP